jgi:hypothetical protein
MAAVTDTTRKAGSLQPGEIVADDQSYDRIRIEAVLVTEDGTVVFNGTRLKFGSPNPVTRYWNINDRVTVHTWED